MPMRSLCAALSMLAAALLAVPVHAAGDPPLVPIGAFFANPKAAWEHRVSPDGARLAWVAMHNGRATLHFRRLEESVARTVETPRELRPPWGGSPSFWWNRDGKRVVFLMDRNGDENAHLYMVDLEAAEPVARDLTPLEGVRVQFYRVLGNEPDSVVVGHNGRMRDRFDLYRLNLGTGALAMLAENPGDVCGWSVASSGQLRARFHCRPDGGWSMTVPDGAGRWREPARGVYGDELRLIGYLPGLRYAWALSNRGRARLALVRLDLRDGSEEPLYEHPRVDIAGALVHESGWLRFAVSWPALQKWRFFDASLQADLAPFLRRPRTVLRVLSEDRLLRTITFAARSDRSDEEVYFLNRMTRKLEVLAEASMAGWREHLAEMEPVTFSSRDGLTLHGLLTLPPGAKGPRPMVLLVHGGPWARDRWGYDPTVQFLANRGYAVLQVNYRGSTELGRAFVLAGVREFGRKMHEDLIDGVRWAVAQGIADERKVAIMGASYGGYAALSGLAFTPEVFVAGVDRVGVADMISLRTDMPPYWRPYGGMLSRFYGDPGVPDERRVMAERSPIGRVDAIRAPLLVIQGANDVRVRRDHADRIVAALKARRHDVEYLLFADEGHGLNRTPNRLAYIRAVERFLARHLGGRDGGE
jgi:dipeptidyl aminopeptidase/acylaminoacyl peptidase